MIAPPQSPQVIPERQMLLRAKMYGGSFVRQLASAWLLADEENSARLRTAFPGVLDIFRHAPEVGEL